MLLPDTQIYQATSSGLIFLCDRILYENAAGILVYDKFSDEDSILGSSQVNPDEEDYYLWKFISVRTTIGAQEYTTIVTRADVGGDLLGRYFTIQSSTGHYFVWYTDGSTTPPVVPNHISVPVTITPGETANAVALLTSIELNSIGLMTTVNNNVITVRNVLFGNVNNASDGDTQFVITAVSDGGVNIPAFSITNSNRYPLARNTIPDFTRLRPLQFNVLTEFEWKIIQSVLKRIDIVRRRYPNLGQRQLGLGFSGGFEKKFSIEELLDFLYQTTVEVNLHSPATQFWFVFPKQTSRIISTVNPYYVNYGVPLDWYDVLVDGTVIKALLARQLFEIDTNFTISDQGISITYERDSKLSNVISSLLNEFTNKKTRLKWQYAPFANTGVGTYFGFSGYHYFNQIAGLLTNKGTIALRSLAPYYAGSLVG
ncbi:MAG: hypothetical protein ABIK31_02780 [candidate division WOR-3 bacterium]